MEYLWLTLFGVGFLGVGYQFGYQVGRKAAFRINEANLARLQELEAKTDSLLELVSVLNEMVKR